MGTALCWGVGTVGTLSAEERMPITFASARALPDEVRDGDLITYDLTTRAYALSRTPDDENLVGVVVLDPAVYMEGDQPGPTDRPIASFGDVYVNASTLGGDIQAGDMLTSSEVAGLAQKAPRDKPTYLLGFALGSLVEASSSDPVIIEGTRVRVGRVLAALRMGPYAPPDARDPEGRGQGSTSPPVVTSLQDKQGTDFDMFKAFRYALAALVAGSAVFVALKRFGDSFAQSIVSVGRNPLARAQVRSVLIWNTFAIIAICGVGIAVGAAIILVP